MSFDRVCYSELFNILLDKKVCLRIVQLLCYMYLNPACCVKWNSKNSNDFSVSNGVKRGAVISPILFTAYMDNLFKQLKRKGIGCHVGPVYAGAFGYTDDVALVICQETSDYILSYKIEIVMFQCKQCCHTAYKIEWSTGICCS